MSRWAQTGHRLAFSRNRKKKKERIGGVVRCSQNREPKRFCRRSLRPGFNRLSRKKRFNQGFFEGLPAIENIQNQEWMYFPLFTPFAPSCMVSTLKCWVSFCSQKMRWWWWLKKDGLIITGFEGMTHRKYWKPRANVFSFFYTLLQVGVYSRVLRVVLFANKRAAGGSEEAPPTFFLHPIVSETTNRSIITLFHATATRFSVLYCCSRHQLGVTANNKKSPALRH